MIESNSDRHNGAFADERRCMRPLASIATILSLTCLTIAVNSQESAITLNDQTLGSPEAPVTLIEYGAPSCPVCARFNADVFPRIKRKYIDTGKVRYIFRLFPLRAEDTEAERLARCMPGNKYFQFMDMLFETQNKWDPEFDAVDPRQALLTLAETTGLPQAKAAECIGDASLDPVISKIAKDAQVKYAVNGTPTFVINGIAQSSGFRSFKELSALLDTELKRRRTAP